MGHRSWMVAIQGDEDAVAVKRWLLNVEQTHGVDWGLRYHSTCIRKDGSVWALIDSDGSGVVDHLMDYGYVPTSERVLLLGEAPSWDESEGPMGSYSDALHSAYLDAEPHDFMPVGSRALEDQFGVAQILLVKDLGQLAEVRKAVEALARRLEPRVVPDIVSTYYTVSEAGAQLLGLMVGNLQSDFLREMTAEIAVEQIHASQMPENTCCGFQHDANTASVWDGEGSFIRVPVVGGSVSDEMLIAMAHENKAEQFRARAGKLLQTCGFEGGYGGFSSADESSRDWHKQVQVGCDRIMITGSCKSRREVKGNRQSAFVNCVELTSWTSTAPGVTTGSDRNRACISEAELGGLAEAVQAFEKALTEAMSAAA